MGRMVSSRGQGWPGGCGEHAVPIEQLYYTWAKAGLSGVGMYPALVACVQTVMSFCAAVQGRIGPLRHNWAVTSDDLLAPHERNERCWCSSGLKYKYCHGNHRPPSPPGAPLPPDEVGSKYLSPSMSIVTTALTGMLSEGFPITMPAHGPEPKPIAYTNWDQNLAATASDDQDVMSVGQLGGLRVEVLRQLASLPDSEGEAASSIVEAVYQLTAASVRSVAQLARQTPRPVILWNQELDVAQFLGRTLLLADYVLFTDDVFDALIRGATNRSLRDAAIDQLKNAELLAAGIAIPVPPGVAMAAQGQAVLDMTAVNLQNRTLVDWVQDQLILEGPTAREALVVRAIDDLAHEAANFWLHARVMPGTFDDEAGSVQTGMLLSYDPSHDYGPWIRQVKNSAVSALVQRTNERIVAADVFGSEYVSASLFEARLLRNRVSGGRIGAAQAALWADIPELTSLTSPDLSKLLKNESAVADLRRQVHAALVTARTDRGNVDAITELTHQLEAASHNVHKAATTNLLWSAVVPGASVAIGGFAGGLLGAGAGALGALAPALGSRLNQRREAAYLFVTARRARR